MAESSHEILVTASSQKPWATNKFQSFAEDRDIS
jgi:hypothetical protein